MNGMRMAFWGLLVAKLVGGWGVQWDIQWHLRIGRDSFWIAPHVMTYASVALAVLLSFGVLIRETLRGGAGSSSDSPRPPTKRFLGLTGTRGFHLAAWGIAVTVLAAPIDDLWHRLFGLDVTLWSPPHLMGLLGSALNTLGCLLIAREVYPEGSRARLAAIVLSGALLYGGLLVTLNPSIRIAYLYGGVRFYTYVFLAVLLLPLALVATARLSGHRWAPLLLLVVLLPVGIAGDQIAQAGFALLQPLSVIDQEILKDPTSPIAVANLIARRNGTVPGRLVGVPLVLAMIPVSVMVAVDPRRRPVAATIGYAAVLFVVSGWALASRPALQPMIPGAAETLLASLLTLASALVGGLAARWLSETLALLSLGDVKGGTR
jgi:hypothetical protein